MALTPTERINISGEVITLPQKILLTQDTKQRIEDVRDEVEIQDDNIKVFFDEFNSTVNSYQNETRWVNGVTSSTIVESQLTDAAQRISGNIFFPVSPSPWINFPPYADPAVNGNPSSISTDDEDSSITTLESNLDFLVNGQTSGVVDDIFDVATTYSGGSATLLFGTGGQTINNLLVLEDGSDSALVLVTNSVGANVTVSEVIGPSGTLSGASVNVIENISGFTNSERNTLIASSPGYQNILTSLVNTSIADVSTWETSLDNQRTELVGNLDDRITQAAEIVAAIADIDTAKTEIDTWQALPNSGSTGSDSKFTNNNLLTITDETAARVVYVATRLTEISTALGSISQSGDGSFSGSGMYFNRFNTINMRINVIAGPLSEFYEKEKAIEALDQIISVSTSKQALYETELETSAFAVNADGTAVINVLDSSGFSASDTIFVMADGLTELTGTIIGINVNQVTLSFSVPATYTTALSARIYKQL